MLYISHAHCMSVVILLLSVTVELGASQSGPIRMESQAHRSPGWTEGNVLGPRPEGVYILSAFTASHS